MHCMYQAMEDIGVDKDLQITLRSSFFKVADHMRNEPEAVNT
ncbi:hypothetical protein BGS_0141 [Beggiatoa sp. SS]|nr:hypothetical protein BGS_0141 [Beggiatoa sp. SS]